MELILFFNRFHIFLVLPAAAYLLTNALVCPVQKQKGLKHVIKKIMLFLLFYL